MSTSAFEQQKEYYHDFKNGTASKQIKDRGRDTDDLTKFDKKEMNR